MHGLQDRKESELQDFTQILFQIHILELHLKITNLLLLTNIWLKEQYIVIQINLNHGY